MQLVSQWEVGAGGGGPLWEIIGVVSGVQFSTDFLTDMTDSTLSIHFFQWLFLLYFVAKLFFYSPCNWSTVHCFLKSYHFLKRLHLVHLHVHLSSFCSMRFKVWWFITQCCHCHVHLHVCSLSEEKVICTEFKTERQDVHSRAEGYHVSFFFGFFLPFVTVARIVLMTLSFLVWSLTLICV